MSCLQILRELGYRMTPQRQAILEALHTHDDHFSTEEVHDEVRARYPQVNISTVYRTLELLKELGLVTQTDLGEGILRYHHIEKGHHHHLICENCGAIIDVDESVFSPLKRTLLQDYQFKANMSHFAIFGRCAKCQR